MATLLEKKQDSLKLLEGKLGCLREINKQIEDVIAKFQDIIDVKDEKCNYSSDSKEDIYKLYDSLNRILFEPKAVKKLFKTRLLAKKLLKSKKSVRKVSMMLTVGDQTGEFTTIDIPLSKVLFYGDFCYWPFTSIRTFTASRSERYGHFYSPAWRIGETLWRINSFLSGQVDGVLKNAVIFDALIKKMVKKDILTFVPQDDQNNKHHSFFRIGETIKIKLRQNINNLLEEIKINNASILKLEDEKTKKYIQKESMVSKENAESKAALHGNPYKK